MVETQATSQIFGAALQERQPVACKLLSSALQRRALSNAYLLTGRTSADKWLIARQLAAFLNCLSRNENEYFSCLSKELESLCQNCSWIAESKHPQAWILLEGEGESGKIPVEKARLLVDEMSKTSRYMRVVVIPNADTVCLHAPAANSLLKNIEEPQSNALFVMFAASQEQVLPTVVSRTQVIPLTGSFQPGLWIDESSQESVSQEKLMALKAEFIHASRRMIQSFSRASHPHIPLVKSVAESQDIFKRLMDLSEDEGFEPELLIDLVLAADLETFAQEAARNPAFSRYLSKLAALSESSKTELNRYVRKQNVLETYAYTLTELRMKYLGDGHLAKN